MYIVLEVKDGELIDYMRLRTKELFAYYQIVYTEKRREKVTDDFTINNLLENINCKKRLNKYGDEKIKSLQIAYDKDKIIYMIEVF